MNNTLPAHRALFSLSFACGATHTQSLKVATIHPCTVPFPHEFYLARRKRGPRSSQAQVVDMHIGCYTIMMKAKIRTQVTQRMTGSGVGLMSVWGNGWGGGEIVLRACAGWVVYSTSFMVADVKPYVKLSKACQLTDRRPQKHP